MKTKHIISLILLFLFLSIGASCPPPQPPNPPIPPEPPVPPIEYVYVDTCIDSGYMRNTYCPDDRIEWNKKYIKGTEPLSWCAFHKEPTPPIPLPEKFETYSINWIGLLPWMTMKAMAGEDVSKPVDRLVELSRRSGAAYIHSFCWVGDPSPDNSYTQFATPWLWVDGKIDFTKKNPEHEKQFRFLAETCKKYDMEFRPIFFMARYNFPAFTRNLNVQGIEDFYTPEAKAVQSAYIFDCIHWLLDIFGPDYKPTVLLMNEPAHYGDDTAAHEIADWHKEIGDYVLQWTTPDRLWVDGSHSEYAHAWFVGPQKCPKCERWLGRDEYSNRPVRSESHGCSTLQGFQDNGFDGWSGSAWTHGAFNEDGSDSGSKLCDGISAFRQANTAEYTTALKYVMDNQGDKKAYIVSFPFDPIKNAMEDYTEAFVLTYDWERLSVYSILHKSQ